MENLFLTSLTLPEIKELFRNEIRNELKTMRETSGTNQSIVSSVLDEFVPIEEIFKRKLMSPPTFYEQVKAGKIALHKVGRKSFIKSSDFHNLFRKVEIAAA